MKQKTTTIRSKAVALGRLWTTSEAEFKAFMNTYDPLFIASAPPEYTKDDYDNGVPLQGYKQGSSRELEQYYKIIHLLCTLGSVEKMYMPPVVDVRKSVLENQILFERQMANDLDVGERDTVLDLGCGCGAIAEHVATLSGCTVYGINIEKSQIEKAWENPLLSKDRFTVADFNKPLDFGDNMFDAIYNVQALTYATDLEFTFKEVFRVLKPGGKFVSNDVAALDNYDRENDDHKLMIQHTRELTAFGGFWHHKYWEDAFKNAGFVRDSILISIENAPDTPKDRDDDTSYAHQLRIVHQSGRRKTDNPELEICDAKTGTIGIVKYQSFFYDMSFRSHPIYILVRVVPPYERESTTKCVLGGCREDGDQVCTR
jgi:sterol 24-C-methyltransferase